MDSSDRRRLFAALDRAGWRVEKARGSGHFKFWDPTGELITTTGGSPSDCNSGRYLLRDLARAGFVWETDKRKQQRQRRRDRKRPGHTEKDAAR